MPQGIHFETQIWEVIAGPSSKQPSSEPRAWYFKFRIRQSLDPDQQLPEFQMRDILAAAMLVKVSQSAITPIAEQPDQAAFRGFAETVIGFVEAS